jgi:hypothetical protein
MLHGRAVLLSLTYLNTGRMRYFFILICSSFLFTGCFTMGALDRAKHDRKPERVKSVLTSYKDTSGNTVVIYKKRNRKSLYKAVVPLDTIISKYRVANTGHLINRDSTIGNFTGVFSVNDGKDKNQEQRIILFDSETPFSDTTGLYREMEKNEHLVQHNTRKLSIPVWAYSTSYKDNIKARVASFSVQNNNKSDSAHSSNEKYIITFKPHRQKKVRYLLIPVTVGLDAVSWPVQIVIGLIALSKVPIS